LRNSSQAAKFFALPTHTQTPNKLLGVAPAKLLFKTLAFSGQQKKMSLEILNGISFEEFKEFRGRLFSKDHENIFNQIVHRSGHSARW
jgi:hypothetical protein